MMTNTARMSFIEFIPASIFGSVMGLCGLSFAWRHAAANWKFTEIPSLIFGYLAIGAFIVLTICYLLKCLKYPSLVIAEFQSPVTICFFATMIICLLLLPGTLLSDWKQTAITVWCIAAVLMLLFALYILRRWIDHRQEPENIMPAWVLPVVGALDIPIIGDKLQLPGIHEFSLMTFGIGSISAIILLTVIISRLIFEPPLPKTLQPSLLILTGPLALTYTVYDALSRKPDIISGTLFYFNIFLLLILGSKILFVPLACPFKVSWWAVSFPLSAVTISALIYAQHKQDGVHELFAALLLILITVVIIYMFFMTIYRVITKNF